MSERQPVALATILHDPENRQFNVAKTELNKLGQIYPAIFVIATKKVSSQLIDALRSQGADIKQKDSSVGEARRKVLQLGLNKGCDFFHYCDFDRIIHWIKTFPEELPKSVFPNIQKYDYLIISRTPRAFNTHPEVQQKMEGISSRIFSLYFGQSVDVNAGCCGVNRQGAELILKHSTASSNATDTEWPAIIQHFGKKIGIVQVEGLEFETPDYYQEEIRAAGSLEKWMEKEYNTLNNWHSRLCLAWKSTEAIQRITSIRKSNER